MSKVCLNHPDRAASDKCIACFKPLCDECIISHNGYSYCSEKCLQQAQSTVQNIEKFKASEKKAKFRRLIRGIIKFLIFLAILAAIGYYLVDKKIIKM
jgi:hypothetical protein